MFGSNQVHAKYQSKRMVLPCYEENPYSRTDIVMKPTGPVNHMDSNNSGRYKRLDKRRYIISL
ncbi:hypothetical protein [Candidatus Nitrosocosmicus sp. R]